MAIHFSEFLSDINSSIYNIPIFNTILSSVVYSSIILSILVIVMLIFVYPSDGIPSSVLVKMFVYLFVVNTLIFSAHYSVMSSKYKEKSSINKSDEFITNINRRGGAYDKDNIKVMPNFMSQEKLDRDTEPETESEPQTVNDMLMSVEKTL